MAQTECSYIDEQSGKTIYPLTCMKCTYYNNNPGIGRTETRQVTMKLVYPSCPRSYNVFCNPKAGAYVAAVTVCNQQLWY